MPVQRNRNGHPMADPARGDWQCSNTECFNHTNFPASYVYGNNVNCKKCGTGKGAQRPGDWCCPNPQCMNHRNCVYGSKTSCPKCGCPKPALSGKGKSAEAAWCPPANNSGGSGHDHDLWERLQAISAHGGQNESSYHTQKAPRHGDWHCPNPACKNHSSNVVYASKTICPMCGTPKPGHPEEPLAPVLPATPPTISQVRLPTVLRHLQQPPAVPSSQEWEQAPQEHSSWQQASYSTSAPKAKGREVRPGDWNCTNPGCKNFEDNVVYANKTHCPLCHTPRPLSAGDDGGAYLRRRARSRSPF